ncbi:MAG: hypothetical protein JNM93_06680 [Bacteriovoracaceae bacterium]|nr:hypothetical protein [Bacteriovoracaceae bacterium]
MKTVMLGCLLILLIISNQTQAQVRFASDLNPALKNFYKKYHKDESVNEMILAFDEAMTKKRSADWKLAFAKQAFSLKLDLDDPKIKLGEVDFEVYELRFKLLNEFTAKFKLAFPDDEIPKNGFYDDAKILMQEKRKILKQTQVNDSQREAVVEKKSPENTPIDSVKVRDN